MAMFEGKHSRELQTYNGHDQEEFVKQAQGEINYSNLQLQQSIFPNNKSVLLTFLQLQL